MRSGRTLADRSDITVLLQAAGNGDTGAADELIPLVYSELRRLAAAYMRRERSDHTLQTTALVHEAYLRLVGQGQQSYMNRAQFFGFAARLMRQILVDHARARLADKRGGGAVHVELDEAPELGTSPRFLLGLDQALSRLAMQGPRQAQIVEMR
ncbi:MAG TPA: ECF-type sigma factor, partial [Terriglobales bacterium]|nr:ECF-type sigma factor [Terriglobales bacterium]